MKAFEQNLEKEDFFMRKSIFFLLVVLISAFGFEFQAEAFKLPDTGQDKCYDFFENMEMTCVSYP